MVKQQDVLGQAPLDEGQAKNMQSKDTTDSKNLGSGYSRRDFLKVLGVSSGLAASGCAGDIPEKIIPYVVQPDEIVPGVASWYSGICSGCNVGCGVLVRVREGRAVKVEGNPNHPVNKGKLCALGQSTLQTLYDPDRVREPLTREAGGGAFKASSWTDALALVAEKIKNLPAGKKAVMLVPPLRGTSIDLTKELQQKIPALEFLEYDTQGSDLYDLAAEASFGKGHRVKYDFSNADTIFSVGADFLETWLSPVEYARQWSERRKDENSKSYFYQVEPRLSLTGASADNWIMNAPGSEVKILLELLVLVSKKKGKEASLQPLIQHFKNLTANQRLGVETKELEKAAERLASSKTSLVVAGGPSVSGGDALSAAVLANALNYVLGNIGSSLLLSSGAESAKSSSLGIKTLVERIEKKSDVGLLFMSSLNPAFSLPKSEGFEAALSKVPFIASLATNLDETAGFANVVLPLSTSFESWFDRDDADGLASLNQPAMRPLYETQSLEDTLLSLAGALGHKIKNGASYLEYLKNSWQGKSGKDKKQFERNVWDKFVETGLQKTAASKSSVSPNFNFSGIKNLNISPLTAPKVSSSPSSVMAFPTIASLDGSSANRPWLQELPNPMTSVVWGTWAELNSQVAKDMGISEGDIIQLKTKDGAIAASAYPTDNIHPELLAVPIGQGHKSMGRYANGIGSNPLSLMPQSSSSSRSLISELGEVTSGSGVNDIVKTQDFEDQKGRGILRTVSASTLAGASHGHGHDDHGHGDHSSKSSDQPDKHHQGGHHDPLALGPQKTPPQMYEQMEHVNYRWGMSVDLASCTGCSACVVACYAENNIPVVGKELCSQGREMSWLRVDRYSEPKAKKESHDDHHYGDGHGDSHKSDPAHKDAHHAKNGGHDSENDKPITGFQPMMCQHCGNAPCEPVCPVYATYHNEEGLNSMVYNRCVGTRYCSNNCSYKVRRFNWFDYTWPEPLNWQLNPDVTVRTVGVMEKCTFCVQRIREGTNNAKNEGRLVKDGDIQPACASTCPTNAITFGNLNDKESEVYKNSQSKRGYKVLDSVINTQPGVTYLAKITE